MWTTSCSVAPIAAKCISVAAPGVDILPAPGGSYQVTMGTSVATAEVSGIVALLLERNPKLTPADIRRILTSSAKRLGPGDRDDNFRRGPSRSAQGLQLADRAPRPRPRCRRRNFAASAATREFSRCVEPVTAAVVVSLRGRIFHFATIR